MGKLYELPAENLSPSSPAWGATKPLDYSTEDVEALVGAARIFSDSGFDAGPVADLNEALQPFLRESAE